MPRGKDRRLEGEGETEKALIFRRGSPMVIGVKCDDQLAANHIPVMFSKGKDRRPSLLGLEAFSELYIHGHE